tara:strand:+ start:431 stop:1408 length:978 start_codon:yes stop_codon:yes gene_type:complete
MNTSNYTLLIGAGYWGEKILDKLFRLNKKIALFDKDKKKYKKFKLKYKTESIIYLKSFEDLKDLNFKSVIISSPAQYHFSQINYFIKLKKNIFVEKPICLNQDELKKITTLLKNYKQVFMIGHIMLFHNSFKKILELNKNKYFGKILYLYSTRLSFGKLRKHENILSSFAPHDISMMLAIMKKIPRIESSSGTKILNNKVFDNSIINFLFPNKTKAHIFVNWLSPFKEQKFVIIGDKRMMVFNDSENWSNKIMIIDKPLIKQKNSLVLNTKKIKYFNTKPNDALKDEINYFLYLSEKNNRSKKNLDLNLKVYELLFKAISKIKKL